jgi:hypothetical protein
VKSHAEMLDGVLGHTSRKQVTADPLQSDISLLNSELMTDDDYIMDFSDTLFSSWNLPLMFPDPKEICMYCIPIVYFTLQAVSLWMPRYAWRPYYSFALRVTGCG